MRGHYIAILTVFRDFLNETNTKEEDTEGFVNFARSIDAVKVAVLMIQREDLKTWRIFIRGKGEVDVQKIARKFGGGGHKDASGCRVVGNYEDVKSKLVDAIAESIDNLEKMQAEYFSSKDLFFKKERKNEILHRLQNDDQIVNFRLS